MSERLKPSFFAVVLDLHATHKPINVGTRVDLRQNADVVAAKMCGKVALDADVAAHVSHISHVYAMLAFAVAIAKTIVRVAREKFVFVIVVRLRGGKRRPRRYQDA